MSKQITSEMVAKKAGVSRATVSLVLNGHLNRVSDETRKKVLKVMDELEYRPNLLARTMKTKRSQKIGIIVEGIAEGWFTQILFGAEEELRKKGYQLLLSSLLFQKSSDKNLCDAIELLLSRQVDGIILITSSIDREITPLKSIISSEIPLILVNFYPTKEVQVPKIYLDYVEAGKISIQHFHSLGKRKIAYIGTDNLANLSSNMRKEVLRGYKKGLKEFGLPYIPEFIKIKEVNIDSSPRERLKFSKGRLSCEMGKKAMEEILTLSERPDAVYCMHDHIAYGAIAAIQAEGLKIPEEVAVIGNNNLEPSEFIVPGLTSIDMQLDRCGYLAARSMLKLLEGEEVEMEVLGPVSLVVRSSTVI